VAPEYTDAQLAAVADARYLMRRAFRIIDRFAVRLHRRTIERVRGR
jgi:hypothetical protein